MFLNWNENEVLHNIAIIRSWRSQFGKIPARDFSS